ncbi:MAG: geranylgeranyl reductase family protein, partial [Pseudomonadales bacterium]|nr:geranylgeranyl reductase family protein [Pseudomonadales bacterium]
ERAMTGQWDVVIVGAGPAGTAAAYDLANQGLKTLILEKKAFPRTKPCAGGLTVKALARLRFPITHLIHDQAERLALGYGTKRQAVLHSEDPICAFVVRKDFDTYCLQQAQEQGAQLRQIKGISGIESTTQGVQLLLDDGDSIHAKFLIGADGAHSQVRRLTQIFSPDRTAIALEGLLPREMVSASFLDHSERMTLDFGAQKLGYGWLFPKQDHVNVGLFTFTPELSKVSKDLLAEYSIKRLGSAEFTDVHGYPIATGGEFYRQSHEHILLVGDAAGMAEPLLGEGIHNAIATGQGAAAAIIKSEMESMSAAAAYQRALLPVQKDLLLSRKIAPWFYRCLPLSYRALVRYPFATVLMNGFAAGLTLEDCKNAFKQFRTQFDVPEIVALKPSH